MTILKQEALISVLWCWRWIYSLSHVTAKEDQHCPPTSGNKRRSYVSITQTDGKSTQKQSLQTLFSLRSVYSRPHCPSPWLRFQNPRPGHTQMRTQLQSTIYYPIGRKSDARLASKYSCYRNQITAVYTVVPKQNPIFIKSVAIYGILYL